MAEVEHATTARLPVETIWDFVRDMDHWAHFVTGYQSHRKESDDDSVWVLKGDLGSLTRRLEFRVRVREWAGPERVVFELEGVNEPVTGHGEFRMERFEEAEADGEPQTAREREGLLTRIFSAIARFFLRRRQGRVTRGADADAGPGAGMARLTFHLRVEPGGPMAPMVDAMMKPAMVAAAEDLANRIVGHLEAERRA